MRNVSFLTILATTALTLSACGASDDTGYLGSRDDIIVTNRNMPAPEPVPTPKLSAEQEADLSAKGEIATLKQTAEEKAEAQRIAAQEKAIEEAKAEALKPIEGRDAEQKAKLTEAEARMAEAKAAMAKQEAAGRAATMKPKMAPAKDVKVQEVNEVMAKEPITKPTMKKMSATQMVPPPEHRKPAPVMASAPAPMAPVDNTGDVPPNAKPGECYAKVLIPAVTETITENVKVAEEQEVLARIVPAKYKIEQEKVLVREARQYWKPGTGPKQKVDQTTGEIMCLVEEPAVYKTIERRVLVEPEKPEYKTMPAQFEKLSKTLVVQPARQEWRRILCETNVTAGVIAQIQKALNAKGLDAGPIDGKLGGKTMNALRKYQSKNSLGGGLTYETLDHLGVSLAGA